MRFVDHLQLSSNTSGVIYDHWLIPSKEQRMTVSVAFSACKRFTSMLQSLERQVSVLSDTANDYYPIYFTSQTSDKSHSNDSTDFLKSSLFEICLSHNFIVTRYTISFGNARHDLLGSLFCFPVRIYFLCSSLQLIFPRHTWQPYLWGNLSVLYIGKGTQTHCRCPQGDN